MWWTDDDVYNYPYCARDTDYYTQFVLDDAATDQDDGNYCSIYEYRTVNYGRCLPNFPGFISDVYTTPVVDTPTETKVNGDAQNYYLVMENDGDYGYTGLTLKQCPQHADLFDDY